MYLMVCIQKNLKSVQAFHQSIWVSCHKKRIEPPDEFAVVPYIFCDSFIIGEWQLCLVQLFLKYSPKAVALAAASA